MTNLWFKRKRYGYGWTPATKEGWWVVVLYTLVVMLAAFTFLRATPSPRDVALFVGVMGFASAALIYVCFRTGETPRWQWGEDDVDTK